MLGDRQPGDLPLPAELRRSIQEWAALAAMVSRTSDPDELELVRSRGRLLASRVADHLGRPVEFTDPGGGGPEEISSASEVSGPPTPWATGMPIAVFAAILVTMGDVALSRAFAEAFGLLWVPANLLVGLGLAPSLYLLRSVPFWRWPAMGTAAGLVIAWVVLLLGLLE